MDEGSLPVTRFRGATGQMRTSGAIAEAHLDLQTSAHRAIPPRLLLDSRVVDVPMAYNSTFGMLSFLKPLLFNSLENEFRFSDNVGA